MQDGDCEVCEEAATNLTPEEAAALVDGWRSMMQTPQLQPDAIAPPKPDIMRDTLVRYLGYANEVGESFRAVAPKFVGPSYVVAYGYAISDSVMKGYAESQLENGRPVAAFADTLIWQSFASVLLPGLTINRVVAATSYAVNFAAIPPVPKRWLPVAVGLSVIPAIIHPIDAFVESMMCKTVRKLTKYTPH